MVPIYFPSIFFFFIKNAAVAKKRRKEKILSAFIFEPQTFNSQRILQWVLISHFPPSLMQNSFKVDSFLVSSIIPFPLCYFVSQSSVFLSLHCHAFISFEFVSSFFFRNFFQNLFKIFFFSFFFYY